MRNYNIADFGAVGDGTTDNAKAIQAAIDTCSSNGGGRVTIPGGGTFMTGPFYLKSYVDFHVENSAIVLANPDESVYTHSAFKDNFGEGSIWMGGENAEKVSITGLGIIDGNGVSFMGAEEKAAYILKPFDTIDPRPHLFTPINITDLTIRDITFKDSAYWCLHLVGCNRVVIDGIRILNNLKVRNSDGIDLDHTKNTHISNCYIESGDDCICLKTRREYEEYGPTENVTVSNCIMTSTSCSVKLGSENMDAIRNVVFTNCIIRNSNRGIGIQNRDEGVVENVHFENCIVEGRLFDDVWWGKAEPIYVTAYPRASKGHKDAGWRFAKGQTKGKVGIVKDIHFKNITCNSENGIFVGGETGKIERISFENIRLEIDKKTAFQGGIYDLRPSNTEGLLKTNTAGFYFQSAKDLSIRNCSVKWGTNKAPWFGKPMVANNIENLEIDNCTGTSAIETDDNPIETNNCTNISINQKLNN